MKLFGPAGVAIAGHHVSYGLLAVMLGLPVAAVAVYQLRQGGGLGVGVTPSAGDTSAIDTSTIDSVGGGGGGGNSDAALQNFGQQLASLDAFMRGTRPLSTPAPLGPTYITNRYTTITKAVASAPSRMSPVTTTSLTNRLVAAVNLAGGIRPATAPVDPLSAATRAARGGLIT